LEVQRKVVIEEFKQRYLNQPYGDVWLKLRPLAYQVHPYQWATIGKEIKHIEEATMEDVKSFFYTHYLPSNAIMVVAGNVKTENIKQLSEKWFGGIPAGKKKIRNLIKEPVQKDKRSQEIRMDVPAAALYKAYHMPGRFNKDFHAADLVSDVLGRGDSSRLHQRLVKDNPIFNSLSAFTMGTIDPGLLVINGRVREGMDLKEAEKALDHVVYDFVETGITDAELEKVKNQALSTLEFGEVDVLNRAMNLAFSALSGDAHLVNRERGLIEKIESEEVDRLAQQILKEENSSVLYYNTNK
jgi:zinc protease